MTTLDSHVADKSTKRRGARTVDREYLSFGEVAQMIGRDRTTIHRWVKKKILPAPVYLTPTSPMFVAAEIRAFREEREAARDRAA